MTSVASVEQAVSQSIQAATASRLQQGSSRSLARMHSAPIEPMEPIEEEKSELAMDIAAAVVEKLDIDRKLDERMRELMLRGDRIFRDIQIRQEQSTEALCRSVGMCLESQRAFHEEHQRLLSAVKELATMVVPFTPLGSQALEAQARASAIVEETNTLQKQMEDNRVASAHAMAAAIAPVAAHMPASVIQQIAPATAAAVMQTAAAVMQSSAPGSGSTFSITLRKADDVSLGLKVNPDEEQDPKALIVEAVLPGGAVESWNRQCFGDGSGERVVVAGDRIVRVNGIDQDVQKMLEECTHQRLVKLVIARANAHPQANVPSSASAPLRHQSQSPNSRHQMLPPATCGRKRRSLCLLAHPFSRRRFSRLLLVSSSQGRMRSPVTKSLPMLAAIMGTATSHTCRKLLVARTMALTRRIEQHLSHAGANPRQPSPGACQSTAGFFSALISGLPLALDDLSRW